MNFFFKPMTNADLPHWERWIKQPHVKKVWFIEGYEPADYIHQKIEGNGYDYPFIIWLDKQPIGFIQCCDLYAWKTKCEKKTGLFTDEKPGTFCMDLFIGESECLNKGYGTQIVKSFVKKVFSEFNAKILLIDPATSNKRAIRCYEKAGFTFVKNAFDGVTDCTVLEIKP